MLHRATVLEDIIHILPPAVAQRVNSVVSESEQAAASEATKDAAQSSSAPASAPVAATKDVGVKHQHQLDRRLLVRAAIPLARGWRALEAVTASP